jgi:hypothetical protein
MRQPDAGVSALLRSMRRNFAGQEPPNIFAIRVRIKSRGRCSSIAKAHVSVLIRTARTGHRTGSFTLSVQR